MIPSEMPANIPSLFIKRFIVLRSGHFAYDQTFKMGVNIIRGDNGTGKSTIMDMIYYALGAEVTEWTDEQKLCDETIIDVAINFKRFCLKREITDTGKAAMYFYSGDAETALSDSLNWHRYPSARSKEKHSFSQQLFELLNLPAHQTDDSKNLTMHQILRLIYVDQITPPTKLLNEDKKHDSPVTRRAIGEFLLGIDDLEAHNLRQAHISAVRKFEEIRSELKTIYRFVSSDTGVLKMSDVDAQISEYRRKIEILEEERAAIRDKQLASLDEKNRKKADSLKAEIIELAEAFTAMNEEISVKKVELIDIGNFLESLESRKKALEHSTLTEKELGELIFEYCPACLTPIAEHSNGDSCGLCKSDLSDGKRHVSYIRMVNEINFQIRESQHLIEHYEKDIERNEANIPAVTHRLASLRQAYNELVMNADTLDAAISDIGADIGFNKAQIANWNEKRKMIQQIDQLVEKKAGAQAEISRLENELERLDAAIEDRKISVASIIEQYANKFITSDGGYENVFEDPGEIFLDFAKDKMSVNGRSKFSASSMVIMKNAIRVAIFIASVLDRKVRLPRLMLMDNIEDKGMMAERSQNFQRLLVSECDLLTNDYQMIFTTSMIDPVLNKSEYVAGPFYKKGEHTLKIG